MPASSFVHLRRAGVSVLIDARGPGQPVVLHWGADLGALDQDALAAAARSTVPAVAKSVIDEPVPRGLLPELARGYRGRPGLSGYRPEGNLLPRLQLAATVVDAQAATSEPSSATRSSVGDLTPPSAVAFTMADVDAGLSVVSSWRLDDTGLLEVRQELTNTGSGPFQLAELAVVLPVPAMATEIMDFSGRWCRERSPQRRPFSFGAWTRENRRGRTAADSAFMTIAGSAGFANRCGDVWAVHLGWSGNQVSWAEALPDGTRVIGAAELLAPGEIDLAGGESYSTPTTYAAFSARGLDGVSDRFHQYLRARPTHPASPRPTILNTWEAVYFDHDPQRLADLADRAAEVGIERFVLDDGWFGGRRNDFSSLGDWDVSPEVWPDGLGPLVSHVAGLGMQFGLWVEPEMVNQDSELYRAHPDWVLGPPDRLPPGARHQQVLDVAEPDVFAHLFGKLDSLVKTYRISYLKWDHNRDLVDAVHLGRPGVHCQTLAVYRLMDELRKANPGLEIESSASGGARVDLGILARTDRIWPTDCDDALERYHVQRWTGLLLPPELIGVHIARPIAHHTGRTHSLSFRAATALFGHLGVEWDISSASDAERAALAEVIALYRRWRPMLHSGTVVNLDHPDPAATVSGIVATDRSLAVFAYVQLTTGGTEGSAPVRLSGLDPDREYTVTVVEPAGGAAMVQRRGPAWINDGGVTLRGQLLETMGLAVPILQPQQALLIELVAD